MSDLPTKITADEVGRMAQVALEEYDGKHSVEGHIGEDQLLDVVLREIAAGHEDPAGLAGAVLPLLDAERVKWFE